MKRYISGRAGATTLAIVALLALGLAGCAGSSTSGQPGGQQQNTPPPATRAPSATSVPLASWTGARPPADTFALQFAPSAPRTAYLCAIDGPAVAPLAHTPRLYRSVDGAKAWSLVAGTPVLRPVTSQTQTLAMCAVFIDAQDARDIFFQQTQFEPVGAGYAVVRALYRSRDGGATWTALREPDRTDGFLALAVYGARLVARPKPSVFGAAGCDPATTPALQPSSQVDVSDDGGQTWRPVGQSLLAQGYSVSDMASAGAALFVTAYQVPKVACQPVTHWTVYRSDDAGATWKPTTVAASSLASLSFTPKENGSGYYGVALASSTDSGWQISYSDDSGVTWRTEPELNTATPGSFVNIAAAPSGELFAQPTGENVVYRLAPGAPAPAWAPYATAASPGVSGDPGSWMVEPLTASERLWSLEVAYGDTPTATLTYLPLR